MSFFEFPHTRTYDSDLGWLIKTVKELLDCCDEMNNWRAEHEEQYQELKDLYDDLMSGNFPDSIKNAFQSWMNVNALNLVGEMVKMIFFELDHNGYLVANIPDPRYDIIFNTTDYDMPSIAGIDFGHLVISY